MFALFSGFKFGALTCRIILRKINSFINVLVHVINPFHFFFVKNTTRKTQYIIKVKILLYVCVLSTLVNFGLCTFKNLSFLSPHFIF